MVVTVVTTTPSVQKKLNLVLDGTFSSTINLDRSMSKFDILENITSNTRLNFFGTEGVHR
jgi:hypothetical protein